MIGIISFFGKTIVILINVLGIWFGVWVLMDNPRSKTNKFFFLVNMILVGWMDLAVAANLVKNVYYSLIFVRLDFALVSLFFIAVFYFSLYFPKDSFLLRFPEYKSFISFSKLFIVGSSIINFFMSLTPYVVRRVVWTKWGLNVILGSLSTLFYIIILISILIVLWILVRKYFILPLKEKVRVQYLIIGAIIFAIFNIIFNTVLPKMNHFEFALVGHYSILFFLGFTAYAIVKKQLFGIRVVLTEILVGAISIILFLQILVSRTPFEFAWKTVLLVLFLVFGYSLIKSVIKEIRYREQLQKAYDDLKKLDKAKSEFISIASHQLRTPLTAIKGYISMILEGDYGPISDKVKKPLENIYKSNERLIKLVNDLLDLSRIESGRIILEKRETSIEDIIKSVIEELKIEADKKGIYLRFKKPEEKIEKLFIDPEKIRNVIMNVIDNSIRYTQKGGVSIWIEKPRVNWLRIVISDTGSGMTKEEVSKIFQSFSRAAAGTKLYTEGAGLGLYIARRFVELHGGRIWAESKGRGKGSTFYIELLIK